MSYKINIILVILLFSKPLVAKSADQALSLNDALFAATQTHPIITNKKDELDASNYGLESSRWGRFVGISAQSMVSQADGSILNILTFDQPIWTGGRITADIASSEARVAGASASVHEAQQQILLRTVTSFCEIIRLQTRIAASEENLNEFRRLLDLITRRAESQISPENERVLAAARYEQAKGEQLQMQMSLMNVRADLEQLISQPVSQIVVPIPEIIVADNLDELLSRATRGSPQIKRLQAEINASEADIDLKKSALMPQLSLRYQKFWGGNFPDDRIFVALSLQPGNGLSSLSNISQSRSKMNASEASREAARKEVSDTVRTDWVKTKISKSEVAVYSDLEDSTRLVYESMVRQYAAGKKGWVEVLNARKEATQAKYLLADSQWSGYLSMMRLKILTGEVYENSSIESEKFLR